MKKIVSFWVLILLLFSSCIGGNTAIIQSPPGSNDKDCLLFKNSKTIVVDDEARILLIEEIFGQDPNLFQSNILISKSENPALDIQAEIDQNLMDQKWRLRLDWIGIGSEKTSYWQKGDLDLFIFLIDNLTSNVIRDYNLRFGITDLYPGDSLLVAFIVNSNLPIIDHAGTDQAASDSMEETLEAVNYEATKSASEIVSLEATQAVEYTQIVQASQTAVSAEQTAAVTPTSTKDPYPDLTLPFQDDFDAGLSPDWRVVVGIPIILDGRLSTASEELRIEIGNSKLDNYTLEFNVTGKDYDNCSFGYFNYLTVGFSSKLKFQYNYSDIDGRQTWYMYDSDEWNNIAKYDDINCGKFRITVSGNLYSTYVNGELVSEIIASPAEGPLLIGIEDGVTLDNLIIK